MRSFDAAEIGREAQRLARRHEQLYQRLSRETGPFDHSEMSLEQMAAHGLKRFNLEPPAADDHPSVVALEHFLRGWSAQKMGAGSAGMDSASANDFVSRYLSSEV
jgi:hypothetical protein